MFLLDVEKVFLESNLHFRDYWHSTAHTIINLLIIYNNFPFFVFNVHCSLQAVAMYMTVSLEI